MVRGMKAERTPQRRGMTGKPHQYVLLCASNCHGLFQTHQEDLRSTSTTSLSRDFQMMKTNEHVQEQDVHRTIRCVSPISRHYISGNCTHLQSPHRLTTAWAVRIAPTRRTKATMAKPVGRRMGCLTRQRTMERSRFFPTAIIPSPLAYPSCCLI